MTLVRSFSSIWMSLGMILVLSVLSGCTSDDPLPLAPPPTPPMDTPPNQSICVSNTGCTGGMLCISGECRSAQCNAEQGCPNGQTCDFATYTCVGNSGPQACTQNTECMAGYFCISGVCQDVECVQDSDCGQGQSCSQNRCVTASSCIDGDLDGYGTNCPAGPDCDDTNAQRNAGMIENSTTLCDDGVDQNCDGVDQQCGDVDADRDGVSEKDGDCNDNNPAINPNAQEIYYNDLDDDCNPATNDDDQDGDGFAAEASGGPDCNDENAMINPVAEDIPGNMIDEDCSGMDRVLTNVDADGDGVSEQDGDCNDDNANISPNRQEIPYNSLDDDCSARTPDNDLDGDGFNAPRDCNDNDPTINPNAREIYYSGVDEDCNDDTRDNDQDGDGYDAIERGGDDCNDNVPNANPGQDEIPYDGVNNDCDDNTPDDDLDNDGFNRSNDCNDMEAGINPDITENAETNCSDNIDHNCVGGDVQCDINALDTDGDGIPDDQDCAPNDINVPGPEEIPNNDIDDDCDPGTPDMVVNCEGDPFDVASSNNQPSTSTLVEDANRVRGQYGALSLCPGDTDWYQIRVNQGDGIEADITFDDEVGDIDLKLYRLNNGQLTEEGLTQIDSSNSVNGQETVYARLASETDTYYIKVYHFRDQPVVQPYSLTVNVFNQCQDDVINLFYGEHNDEYSASNSLREEDAFISRQLCDYDEDWYVFTQENNRKARIDLIFDHAQGDLELSLYDEEDEELPMEVSYSSDSNEVIEVDQLPPGEYRVRVHGYQGAQNQYKIFKSSGQLATQRFENNDDQEIFDMSIEDNGLELPGVLEYTITFPNIPRDAIVKSLKIYEIDINHECVGDLEVSLLWDGIEIENLWSRGGENCLDGGGDDDGKIVNAIPNCVGGAAAAGWNRRLGNDLCFAHRTYDSFAGLSAIGEFTLRITDQVEDNTGELVNFDVEIEYFLP